MTDAHGPDQMSAAGNAWLNTPNMDRLCENGILFKNAYTIQPQCVPCRTSIQTGRWPHQTGIMINRIGPLDAGIPSDPMLGPLFREAGYACGYQGNMHVAHVRLNGSRGLDLLPEDVELHGYDPVGEVPDSDIGQRFADFLAGHPEEPFFFTASIDDPHTCLKLGQDPNSLADEIGQAPDDPALLPPLPDNWQPDPSEPTVVREYYQTMEADKAPDGSRAVVSDGWSELQWRQYIWAYKRLIERADASLGQVLDALEASGRAEDTLVIFCADHGDGAGHRRRRKKQVLYDEIARVPFIVSGVGVKQCGIIDTEHLVSLMDIMPTFMEAAGLQCPAHIEGRSLLPLLAEPASEHHPYVVTEVLFNKGLTVPGWAGRLLRTRKHKYVLYNHGDHAEQLFDMERDPSEQNNLASDPAYQEVLEMHRAHLREWCEATGDTFLSTLKAQLA